jgi:dipeptidyl aminopeptidase/acylaminoacyl peptidase
MRSSPTFLCAVLAATLPAPGTPATTPPQPAAVAPVPVAAFFDAPAMSEPVLSPNGDAVAVLVRNAAGRRELAVVDARDPGKIDIAASFDDADVADAAWVDATRLVFSTRHEDASAGQEHGGGLYAVDRTGENLRTLIRPPESHPRELSYIRSRALEPDHQFVRTLADGSGDIIIQRLLHRDVLVLEGRRTVEVDGTLPLRLDTRTGITKDLLPGRLPDHAWRWIVDDQGHVVAVETQFEGESKLLVPAGPGAWIERSRFASYGQMTATFHIRDLAVDGRVYVVKSTGADETAALFRLDLATGQPEAEPILSLKGFDFGGRLVEDRRARAVLGARYETDAPGTAWFDAGMKTLQARIDARLPGLVNQLAPAACGCSTHVLVSAFSDRQPPLYFLYDRADDTLARIGASRPDIDPRRMAATDFVRIRTRDGQQIPVYVTKPQGTGPWPAVVLVHGGPFVRGWHWTWDGESQFLASRGYLVVKPEFRGSAGYGWPLLRSGFRQWGLAMQDDIADAARWAAAHGLADPRRTCIAGASYGGYAALMGLVRDGDLYRCGIAWSAVTDITLMHDLWWSDMGDEWRGFGMPAMVGDPARDATQLEATSPLRQAARITRPLLLAHGGVDRRVPIEHATRMRDALLAHHADLTWILYPDEGHGWSNPATRIDFYTRVEAFLAAHDGAAARPAPAAAE